MPKFLPFLLHVLDMMLYYSFILYGESFSQISCAKKTDIRRPGVYLQVLHIRECEGRSLQVKIESQKKQTPGIIKTTFLQL